MARSWEEITQLTYDMMNDRSLVLTRMREVQQRYEGDYLIPVPDVDKEPYMPQITPALIGEAVDKTAQRACSVQPMLTCPAINPALDEGRRSLGYADVRRRAIRATYYQSKWGLGWRRAYRQLTAYATTSMVVVPDFRAERPSLQVRDPLHTFAETVAENELRPPDYGAFVTRHSGARIRKIWPETRSEQGGPITPLNGHMEWEVLEWMDTEQTAFGLLGPVVTNGTHITDSAQARRDMMIGKPYPNRIGMSALITPANVSLNRIASRISTLLGNVDLQAKMMALDILAQEKAIFPDMYAIGRQGGNPTIASGSWQDGREGNINMLTDVEQVGLIRNTPDQRTPQIIDKLERNFRISTGLAPQYGGESYGSLRTGRALDSMMGMSIDPTIQEMHEVMAAWMPHMNAAILATYKSYWGSKTFSMYSGWPGDDSVVEFLPDRHFETFESAVTYPIPGADVVQQTQILGSLLGTGAISQRTFRTMHPWVTNPEAERRLVDEEQFELAARQALVGQLQGGQLPLPIAGMVAEHMRKGRNVFEALELVDEEMKRRQATEAPPPPEGMAAPPEAMAGLAAGPTAMQQPMAQVPDDQIDVPEGPEQMRALMRAMAGQ
jgi:hypothetical protein